MYYLKAEHSFDSAHFLYGYEGKCKNLHGHRFTICAVFASETLHKEGQLRGMVDDFSNFKHAVKSIANSFDHAFIYEKNSLKQLTIDALNAERFNLIEVAFRPTAENFACHFYNLLKEQNLPIKSVEVFETPTNSATYEE